MQLKGTVTFVTAVDWVISSCLQLCVILPRKFRMVKKCMQVNSKNVRDVILRVGYDFRIISKYTIIFYRSGTCVVFGEFLVNLSVLAIRNRI